MKPKNKILKKALTIVGALLASTAITTTALAGWEAPNDNSPIWPVSKDGVQGYGWKGDDAEAHLSWRINLYVSTLADGTADPSSSSFTTESGLKRVGSIIYTNETSIGRNILLQTEYSDNSRNNLQTTCTTKWGQTVYNIPTTVQLGAYNTGSEYGYPDDYGRVYVRTGSLGDTIKLPTKYSSSLSCATDINPVISNIDTTKPEDQFICNVMDHLEDYMGSQLLTNIKSAVHPNIKIEAQDYASSLMKEGMPSSIAAAKAMERLYPTSDEPLVAYVLTAVPMMSFTALQDTGSFWFWGNPAYKDNGSGQRVSDDLTQLPDVVPAKGREISIVLDAYGIAKYNNVTREFYSYPVNIDYLENRGIIGKRWDGVYSRYPYGQLEATYGTEITCYTSNVASVSGEGLPLYFGFPTNPGGAYIGSRETGQLKGGLALAHFDIDPDNSTPINYYIRTYTITEDQLKEAGYKPSDLNNPTKKLNLINTLAKAGIREIPTTQSDKLILTILAKY